MLYLDKKRKREQIGLIVLSVIDLITGILSIILSAISVQIIAVLASGATLFKAIKVIIQSEKALKLLQSVEPIIIKTAVRVAPFIIMKIINRVRKYKNKEQITMKAIFRKIANEIKNNPITTALVTAETALGAGGAYGLIETFFRLNVFENPVYNYVTCIAIAMVSYIIMVIATIYIGRDDDKFAILRKIYKVVGGERLVNAAEQVHETFIEEQQQIAEAEALAEEKRRKDDEIYALVQAEEKQKAEIERAMKIEAYKQAHPELFAIENQDYQVIDSPEEFNKEQPIIIK